MRDVGVLISQKSRDIFFISGSKKNIDFIERYLKSIGSLPERTYNELKISAKDVSFALDAIGSLFLEENQ